MAKIEIIRDSQSPEWSTVVRDGDRIGEFGRTEEFGIVRWEAFDALMRRLGSFGGRGARSQALAAVVAGTTEVDRMAF